jgi:toluene monooxygenase electron transfer component
MSLPLASERAPGVPEAGSAFRVRIAPDGPTVLVYEGEDILGAARRQGVWLPFECGWGSCATCKATLVEGEVDLLFPHAPAIDPRDARRRRILLCQSTPRSDLVIKPLRYDFVPPPERPVTEHEAVIEELEDVGPSIRRITVRIEGDASFRAGQAAIVRLGPNLRRCYSMAAPPAGPFVRFVAKRYAGKPGSEALFALREGDRLPLALPFGDVWVRSSAEPMVFLAGGTGISAIGAMVHHVAGVGASAPVAVCYGAATPAELVLLDELRDAVSRISDARLLTVVERPDSSWKGPVGYVTDALRLLGPLDPATRAYVAGPPAMVDATCAAVRGAGISLDRLHYDRFG